MRTKKDHLDRDFSSDIAIPINQVLSDSLPPEVQDLIELLVEIAIDRQALGNTHESRSFVRWKT